MRREVTAESRRKEPAKDRAHTIPHYRHELTGVRGGITEVRDGVTTLRSELPGVRRHVTEAA